MDGFAINVICEHKPIGNYSSGSVWMNPYDHTIYSYSKIHKDWILFSGSIMTKEFLKENRKKLNNEYSQVINNTCQNYLIKDLIKIILDYYLVF